MSSGLGLGAPPIGRNASTEGVVDVRGARRRPLLELCCIFAVVGVRAKSSQLLPSTLAYRTGESDVSA